MVPSLTFQPNLISNYTFGAKVPTLVLKLLVPITDDPSMSFDPLKDIESTIGSLSAQMIDLKENITSILIRNNIADEDIQGIKSDMNSLEAKILAIKVSLNQGRFPMTLHHNSRFYISHKKHGHIRRSENVAPYLFYIHWLDSGLRVEYI